MNKLLRVFQGAWSTATDAGKRRINRRLIVVFSLIFVLFIGNLAIENTNCKKLLNRIEYFDYVAIRADLSPLTSEQLKGYYKLEKEYTKFESLRLLPFDNNSNQVREKMLIHIEAWSKYILRKSECPDRACNDYERRLASDDINDSWKVARKAITKSFPILDLAGLRAQYKYILV